MIVDLADSSLLASLTDQCNIVLRTLDFQLNYREKKAKVEIIKTTREHMSLSRRWSSDRLYDHPTQST